MIAAQAFHWFDHATALGEIERILRPGGFLVCVWNVRNDTVDWVRRHTAVVDRYAGDTPRHRFMKWRQAIDASRDFDLVDDWSIPNPQPTTLQRVVERALSTSFIAALEPTVQGEVLDEIRGVVRDVGESFDFPIAPKSKPGNVTLDSLPDAPGRRASLRCSTQKRVRTHVRSDHRFR